MTNDRDMVPAVERVCHLGRSSGGFVALLAGPHDRNRPQKDLLRACAGRRIVLDEADVRTLVRPSSRESALAHPTVLVLEVASRAPRGPQGFPADDTLEVMSDEPANMRRVPDENLVGADPAEHLLVQAFLAAGAADGIVYVMSTETRGPRELELLIELSATREELGTTYRRERWLRIIQPNALATEVAVQRARRLWPELLVINHNGEVCLSQRHRSGGRSDRIGRVGRWAGAGRGSFAAAACQGHRCAARVARPCRAALDRPSSLR